MVAVGERPGPLLARPDHQRPPDGDQGPARRSWSWVGQPSQDMNRPAASQRSHSSSSRRGFSSVTHRNGRLTRSSPTDTSPRGNGSHARMCSVASECARCPWPDRAGPRTARGTASERTSSTAMPNARRSRPCSTPPGRSATARAAMCVVGQTRAGTTGPSPGGAVSSPDPAAALAGVRVPSSRAPSRDGAGPTVSPPTSSRATARRPAATGGRCGPRWSCRRRPGRRATESADRPSGRSTHERRCPDPPPDGAAQLPQPARRPRA